MYNNKPPSSSPPCDDVFRIQLDNLSVAMMRLQVSYWEVPSDKTNRRNETPLIKIRGESHIWKPLFCDEMLRLNYQNETRLIKINKQGESHIFKTPSSDEILNVYIIFYECVVCRCISWMLSVWNDHFKLIMFLICLFWVL